MNANRIWRATPVTTVRQLMRLRFDENAQAMQSINASPITPVKRPIYASFALSVCLARTSEHVVSADYLVHQRTRMRGSLGLDLVCLQQDHVASFVEFLLVVVMDGADRVAASNGIANLLVEHNADSGI